MSEELQLMRRPPESRDGDKRESMLYFCFLVESGPISVTIHVQNTKAHVHNLLRSLQALHASSDSMATYVDVHLVIDSFDRQFNTWRNIARLFARTEFVLMLDVDFAIAQTFASR